MTRIKANLSKSVVALSASLVFCTAGLAASSPFVFDNTTTPVKDAAGQNRAYSPGNNIEFGDQLFLAGSERRITDFQFDYFLSANANGNETGQLSFYLNNGAGGSAPGTLLYRSVSFPLDKGYQTVVAQGLSITVPNTFTWSFSFGGIDVTEQAGLLLFDPPTVGASLNDFWVKNTDGTWSTLLIDGGATPGNFSARVTAVPEPTTLAFGLSMVLAWLGYRGYKRRSA